MQTAVRFVITVSIGLLLPINALAYLDPGTGSMLLQGVLAAIAIIGATLKLYWHRLKALLSGKKLKEENISVNQPISQTGKE